MLRKTIYCAISATPAQKVIILSFMTRIWLEVTTLQSPTRAEVEGVGQGGVTKEEKEETALVSEAEVEVGAAQEPSMPHHPALQ